MRADSLLDKSIAEPGIFTMCVGLDVSLRLYTIARPFICCKSLFFVTLSAHGIVALAKSYWTFCQLCAVIMLRRCGAGVPQDISEVKNPHVIQADWTAESCCTLAADCCISNARLLD